MQTTVKVLVILNQDFSQVTKARFPLPELTAWVDGWPVSITRQHGPCWQARISTSRVDGPCWRVMETSHPSTQAVKSGSENQA